MGGACARASAGTTAHFVRAMAVLTILLVMNCESSGLIASPVRVVLLQSKQRCAATSGARGGFPLCHAVDGLTRMLHSRQ